MVGRIWFAGLLGAWWLLAVPFLAWGAGTTSVTAQLDYPAGNGVPSYFSVTVSYTSGGVDYLDEVTPDSSGRIRFSVPAGAVYHLDVSDYAGSPDHSTYGFRAPRGGNGGSTNLGTLVYETGQESCASPDARCQRGWVRSDDHLPFRPSIPPELASYQVPNVWSDAYAEKHYGAGPSILVVTGLNNAFYGGVGGPLFDPFTPEAARKIADGCKAAYPGDPWQQIHCASVDTHLYISRTLGFTYQSDGTGPGARSFCRDHAHLFGMVFDDLGLDARPAETLEVGPWTHMVNKITLRGANGKAYSYVVDAGWDPDSIFPYGPDAKAYHHFHPDAPLPPLAGPPRTDPLSTLLRFLGPPPTDNPNPWVIAFGDGTGGIDIPRFTLPLPGNPIVPLALPRASAGILSP